MPNGIVIAQHAGGPRFHQSPVREKVACITNSHGPKPPVNDSTSICTNFPQVCPRRKRRRKRGRRGRRKEKRRGRGRGKVEEEEDEENEEEEEEGRRKKMCFSEEKISTKTTQNSST